VWKRFRAACDKFFERKAAHFSSVDSVHEQNLKLKQALLEEMKAADITAGGFEAIKAFQRRWSQIGFVPIKHKDALQKEYKAVVDGMFTTLRSNERDRSMNRFKERVSNMKSGSQLRSEREKLYNKVRQMEQDIALLENNIGFFSKSKNAESLIADVREKIERTKHDMAELIEKVRLIDAEETKQKNA
jgi:transcription initiation factor IIF auxiliary subunit